jgi:FkbM family methyltransferase
MSAAATRLDRPPAARARADTMTARLARVPLNVVREWRRARARITDRRSFLRYAADVVLYRVLAAWRIPSADRERRIRLDGGLDVAYRLNRGDICTLREVWIDECYRPPVAVPVRTLVDLGANIGLTSLWYATRLGAERLVCVEPSPQNARLARRNLAANGVRAAVLEAAVGPLDGTARFAAATDANVGRLAADGEGAGVEVEVEVVSMDTVLEHLGGGAQIDLLKLDIEGGEAELLKEGDLAWLDRVDAVIAEFHLDRVDRDELVGILEHHGLRYVPAGSAHPDSMDFFVRR